ncbi:MAG: hypothetical protein AAF800_09530 [Planctomycetota bacterium]
MKSQHTIHGATLFVVGVMLVGCVDAKGPGADTSVGERDGEGWRPEPVALRIYPSTRFVNEAGTPLLEARVELFDEMGDSTKASGLLRFELFAAGQVPGIEVGRLLYGWDITLATLEDQQRYYDPITRGYLLRLRLESAEATQRQVRLRVTFQPATGRRMSDEQPVRLAW